MHFTRIFLLLLTLQVPVGLTAQNVLTLKGVVKDALNAEPVAGANVSYRGMSAVSDKEGNFMLSVLVDEQSVSDTLKVDHFSFERY